MTNFQKNKWQIQIHVSLKKSIQILFHDIDKKYIYIYIYTTKKKNKSSYKFWKQTYLLHSFNKLLLIYIYISMS